MLHYQFLNSKLILNYNIINFFNLSLDNNKKDISPRGLSNGKKRIKLMDNIIDNNKKNIKPEDIDK